MRSTILACGDCAAVLLAAGGERDTATTQIGLGATCQVHFVAASPQATSAILSGELFRGVTALEWGRAVVLAQRARATEPKPVETAPAPATSASSPAPLPPPWAPPLGPTHTQAFGPVTQVACSLLSAWSHGDGTQADPLMVENAAIVARQLLRATGGA